MIERSCCVSVPIVLFPSCMGRASCGGGIRANRQSLLTESKSLPHIQIFFSTLLSADIGDGFGTGPPCECNTGLHISFFAQLTTKLNLFCQYCFPIILSTACLLTYRMLHLWLYPADGAVSHRLLS